MAAGQAAVLAPNRLGEDAVGDELGGGDADDCAGLDTAKPEDGTHVIRRHGVEPKRALAREASSSGLGVSTVS